MCSAGAGRHAEQRAVTFVYKMLCAYFNNFAIMTPTFLSIHMMLNCTAQRNSHCFQLDGGKHAVMQQTVDSISFDIESKRCCRTSFSCTCLCIWTRLLENPPTSDAMKTLITTMVAQIESIPEATTTMNMPVGTKLPTQLHMESARTRHESPCRAALSETSTTKNGNLMMNIAIMKELMLSICRSS